MTEHSTPADGDRFAAQPPTSDTDSALRRIAAELVADAPDAPDIDIAAIRREPHVARGATVVDIGTRRRQRGPSERRRIGAIAAAAMVACALLAVAGLTISGTRDTAVDVATQPDTPGASSGGSETAAIGPTDETGQASSNDTTDGSTQVGPGEDPPATPTPPSDDTAAGATSDEAPDSASAAALASPTAEADSQANAVEPTPTAPAPTATPQPTPTTPAPTATPQPTPTSPAPTATPQPTPTTPPQPTPTTTPASNCYARLSMVGGWSWVCGDIVCDAAVPQAGCPTTPPGPSNECYLGLGPADGPQWVCGGVYCSPPDQPCGDGGDSGGPTINCVTTPCPQPSFSCSISPLGLVAVGESLTFTSLIDPPGWEVTISFDHGDGTIDPRPISQAYYLAPGAYPVTMLWESGGESGAVACGTVTVVADTPGSDVDVSGYIGLTGPQAAALAESNGFVSRIIRIDDEHFNVTMDFRLDRLNFEIDNGLVTAVGVG